MLLQISCNSAQATRDTSQWHALANVYVMNNLLTTLAASPGIYRGSGDGPESGPFEARLEVRALLDGGAVTMDYEAVGSHGLQHVDHCMLASDERDRLELHVVCGELPGIVRFTQTDPGVFVTFEPIKAKIVIQPDDAGTLRYAWWWTRDDNPAKEQSCAVLKRKP